METGKLKDYLKTILDMEKELIVLNNTISNLQSNITNLENNIPNEPYKPFIDKKNFIVEFFRCFFAPFIIGRGCVGVFIIIAIIIMYLMLQSSIEWGQNDTIFKIIGIVIAYIVICILIAIVKTNAYNHKEKNTYPMRMKQYESDMYQYEEECRKRNINIKIFSQQLADSKNTYNKTKNMRDEYYSLNIIPDEQYWDIVPVSMFYQYIKDGRTYSLERNPVTADVGAINMYEEEKDRKIIITQLSQINESISRLQQVLYDAIQDCKQQTARLTDGINSMHADIIENKKYSAISAYNSQQSVRLQHRQNDILYYRY